MKKFIVLTVVNIFLVIIQSSFLGELAGATYTPNLVLAFAYSLFFMDLLELSLMSAFIGGLLLDLFGFSIVGLSPLILTGTLVLFTFVKRYLFRGWLSNIVTVFLAEIFYLNILFGFSSDRSFVSRVALVTLLFSFVFYFVNQSLLGYFGRSGYKLSK